MQNTQSPPRNAGIIGNSACNYSFQLWNTAASGERPRGQRTPRHQRKEAEVCPENMDRRMLWFFHKEREKRERAGEKESKNEELGRPRAGGTCRSWQRWKAADLRKKGGIGKSLDRNMSKKTNLRSEFVKEIAAFKKTNSNSDMIPHKTRTGSQFPTVKTTFCFQDNLESLKNVLGLSSSSQGRRVIPLCPISKI